MTDQELTEATQKFVRLLADIGKEMTPAEFKVRLLTQPIETMRLIASATVRTGVGTEFLAESARLLANVGLPWTQEQIVLTLIESPGVFRRAILLAATDPRNIKGPVTNTKLEDIIPPFLWDDFKAKCDSLIEAYQLNHNDAAVFQGLMEFFTPFTRTIGSRGVNVEYLSRMLQRQIILGC